MATHRLREPIDQKMEKCPRPMSPPRTAQPPRLPLLSQDKPTSRLTDHSLGPYIGPLFLE